MSGLAARALEALLFRRPTVLRVQARSADTVAPAVNLYPGDTYVLRDDGSGQPIFKMVFTAGDGLELIQVAPYLACDPESLRRWADFNEANR